MLNIDRILTHAFMKEKGYPERRSRFFIIITIFGRSGNQSDDSGWRS